MQKFIKTFYNEITQNTHMYSNNFIILTIILHIKPIDAS